MKCWVLFIYIGFQVLSAQDNLYKDIAPAREYYEHLKSQKPIDYEIQLENINRRLSELDEKDPEFTAYQIWKLRYLFYTKQNQEMAKQIKLVKTLDKDLELELVCDLFAYLHHTRVIKAIDFPRLKTIEQKLKQSSINNKEITGLIYDWIGRSYVDFNEFEKAKTYLFKAIKIFKTNNYKVYLSTSYNVLGIVYDGLEDFENAITYYQYAAKLSAKAPQPGNNVIASAYYNIGLLYNDRLKIADSAVKYYRKAKIYDKKVDSLSNPYLTYDDIGLSSAYLSLKNLKEAKTYANSALVNAKQNPTLNDYNILLAYNNLANIYETEKQLDSAYNYYQKSRSIIDKVKADYNQKRWLANVIVNQADILYKMQRKDEALALLKKHMTSITSLDRGVFSIPLHELLFQIYLDKKQYELALKAWKDKDQFMQEKFSAAVYLNLEHQIDLLDYYAEIESHQAFFGLSDNLLEKIAKQKFSRHLEIEIKAKVWRFKLDNNAEFNTNKLINETQELVNFIKNNYTKNYFLEDNQYFSEFVRPIINDYLLVLHDQYKFREDTNLIYSALQLIDTYKTASLTKDQLSGDSAEQKKLKDQQNRLNAVQNQIFQQNNQAKKNTYILQKLYKKEAQLLGDIKDISSTNKDDHSDFFDLADLKQLQNSMTEDHSILSFFMFHESIFAIHLTSDKIEFNLSISQPLTFLEQYYHTVSRPQLEIKNTTVKAESIFGYFNLNSKLTILPDGILGGISFENLSYRNKPLISNYEVSYMGSLNTVAAIKSNSQSINQMNWIGFAPEYKRFDLQDNTFEIQRIAEITNGEVVQDKNATKEAFKSNVSKASVMHIAAHGKIDNFNPMNSYLAFSDINSNDSKLRLEEVSRYTMPLDLLVLSACESGIGRFNYGDGMMSMGKSFERAGVSASIMTLWKVPDRESGKIMQSFYKHLQDKNTISTALRKAKQEYLDSTDDELLKHPFYWAGFICYGDCDQKFETSFWSNQTILLILGILFIGGLALFSIYKRLYRS